MGAITIVQMFVLRKHMNVVHSARRVLRHIDYIQAAAQSQYRHRVQGVCYISQLRRRLNSSVVCKNTTLIPQCSATQLLHCLEIIRKPCKTR